ncbi:MAG: LD-carboxypeptidase [Clostridia bacterium]|nr:LD-carboxypeptidase [Clostridia bacterium]
MVKKVQIVSLSSGIIGEHKVKHETTLGIRRLEEYGLTVSFSKHALSGLDYIKNHPEKRADDLIEAFCDDSDMILCAIGGDDTYRLLPYLFEDDRLKRALKNKIFLGFSDTTMNHLMLDKLNFPTFYGQSFLADICELDKEMLPYSEKYFSELIRTGKISKIVPSDIWYYERESYGKEFLGTKRRSQKDRGFELISGKPRFEGKILGGCIDSIYDIFDNSRYPDTVSLCEKYELFPKKEMWKNKILLLETSEEKPSADLYRKMLIKLKNAGVFDVISGMLIGKPMDEYLYSEYKQILLDVVNDPELPIVYNVNVGHAQPHCIIPFGVLAKVDAEKQEISFEY